MKIKFIAPAFLLSLLAAENASAQNSYTADELVGRRNVITSACPFLGITPDSRAAGMGDVGVATTPDAASIYWNTAKLAFADKRSGFMLSYAPWLRQLVPDVSYSYVSAYAKIGKRSAFSGSLRYFNMGQINFTDNYGQALGSFTPNEFAVDMGYATQLSKHFSMGANLKFIYSNLTGGRTSNGTNAKAGIAGAFDLGGYYTNSFKSDGKKYDYAWGFNFSNIGNKISYTTAQNADFLPMNLRVGGSIAADLDQYNRLTFNLDLNKLLVPTYPVYAKTESGQDSIDGNGNRVILFGRDPNQAPIQAIFQSFTDAPGGFKEELKEIMLSTGLEYAYDKQFFVRGGLFMEAKTKGGRQYATVGAGLRYSKFGLDLSYLIPFQQRNPLQNTIRFTLLFDFASADEDGGKK